MQRDSLLLSHFSSKTGTAAKKSALKVNNSLHMTLFSMKTETTTGALVFGQKKELIPEGISPDPSIC